MAFELETLGIGTGGGLIGAILGVLGINRRVNKVEETKQDKALCENIHKGIDTQFSDIKEGQRAIFEELKDINKYLRNGK